MSGDHNMYQKDKSYLDFECPRCGHCCKTDLARVGEVGVWGEWFDCTDEQLIEEVRRRGFVIRDAQIEVPKQWVGLTDEDEIPWDGVDAKSFARAIEAKLKEKNHG